MYGKRSYGNAQIVHSFEVNVKSTETRTCMNIISPSVLQAAHLKTRETIFYNSRVKFFNISKLKH